jgi:hypothetical protein
MHASSISSVNRRHGIRAERLTGRSPPSSSPLSLFDRAAGFPRPDRGSLRPSRADAVKAGRHAKLAARSHA